MTANDRPRRPRVVWITNIWAPYREPLWRALAADTDLCVVLMAHEEPNRDWVAPEVSEDYDIVHLDARSFRLKGETQLYWPSLRMIRLLLTRPTAVFTDGWDSPAYMIVALSARLLRLRYFIGYRGTLESNTHTKGLIARVRRTMLRSAHAVFTSGIESTSAVESYGVPSHRVLTTFNLADTSFFKQALSLRALVASESHRFLYVGQLIDRKNVDGLLTAFAQMQRGGDSLTLVGSGVQLENLQNLTTQLHLNDHVTFRGNMTPLDLLHVYANHDTLVLPSHKEVWGLVVNEALSAGLHVVVSTACGCVSAVSQMQGVTVCDPEVSNLAQGLTISRDSWSGPIIDSEINSFTANSIGRLYLNAMLNKVR